MLTYLHFGNQIRELLHEVSEGLQGKGISVQGELEAARREIMRAEGFVRDPRSYPGYDTMLNFPGGTLSVATIERGIKERGNPPLTG